MQAPFIPAIAGLILSATVSLAFAQDVPWPVRVRQDLGRVGAMQWKLRSAAGDRCALTLTDIGAVFDHRQAYDPRDWAVLQSAVGMSGDAVLAGVSQGSPVARAGLVPGDVIVSIANEPAADIAARKRREDSVADALDRYVGNQPADRPIVLVVARTDGQHTVSVTPVRHCGVRLILEIDRKVDAHSDGRDVAVTSGLLAYAATEDEFAMAAAHEFGHAIGRHTAQSPVPRRQREDEADVTGIRLVACAGFDTTKAMMLYRRLARGDILAFLRAPTHRKYSARIALMSDALEKGHDCPPS